MTLPAGSAQGSALDPAGFGLMTWNVFKAQAEHWREDFARLSVGQDLVLLQEAHLTPPFRAALEQSGYRWYMVRAFDYNGAEAGVLTAGRVPASGVCLSRVVEPLIRTPKSALLTRYPLDGSPGELWVANLHSINFTLGTGRFREQIESLAEMLEPHRGPLILAGDFNNWNDRRSAILRRVTGRMKLAALTLTEDQRSLHWGHPVDQVFYRGLEVVRAEAVAVSSSDHNPVRVQFRVPGRSRENEK
jgi:endonuclease/exonuclease/phosphatase (EEP) superfamily protein YafD